MRTRVTESAACRAGVCETNFESERGVGEQNTNRAKYLWLLMRLCAPLSIHIILDSISLKICKSTIKYPSRYIMAGDDVENTGGKVGCVQSGCVDSRASTRPFERKTYQPGH